MEWFARHTNWLYRETKELSENSTYREQYQFIDKTLISSGNVLVHKSKTEYFPILIVYPEATPYIPPMIYILDNEISEETAIEYSEFSPEETKQHVRANIRFFNRRHQGEDGSVCFVEMGDLHDENPEIYPIEHIINRLRIWLSGRIPKDSLEVELFHHFPNRTYEIQYLLPDLGEFSFGTLLDLLITCFAINSDLLDILHIYNFNKSLLEKMVFSSPYVSSKTRATDPPQRIQLQDLTLYISLNNRKSVRFVTHCYISITN